MGRTDVIVLLEDGSDLSDVDKNLKCALYSAFKLKQILNLLKFSLEDKETFFTAPCLSVLCWITLQTLSWSDCQPFPVVSSPDHQCNRRVASCIEKFTIVSAKLSKKWRALVLPDPWCSVTHRWWRLHCTGKVLPWRKTLSYWDSKWETSFREPASCEFFFLKKKQRILSYFSRD